MYVYCSMSKAEKNKLDLLTKIANLTDPQVIQEIQAIVEDLLAPPANAFTAQELAALRDGYLELQAGKTVSHEQFMASGKVAIKHGLAQRKAVDGTIG